MTCAVRCRPREWEITPCGGLRARLYGGLVRRDCVWLHCMRGCLARVLGETCVHGFNKRLLSQNALGYCGSAIVCLCCGSGVGAEGVAQRRSGGRVGDRGDVT